jgi:hypothetical protein
LIQFVKRNSELVQRILQESNSKIKYQYINSELQKRKRRIGKIGDLKELWLKSSFSKEMRIISCYFLRKFAHKWIFNSRVETFRWHLKYRLILLKALRTPEEFKYLKTDF